MTKTASTSLCFIKNKESLLFTSIFSMICGVFFQEPTDTLKVEQKQLVMNNVSSLPLTVGLKLNSPFCMIIGEDKVSETVSFPKC